MKLFRDRLDTTRPPRAKTRATLTAPCFLLYTASFISHFAASARGCVPPLARGDFSHGSSFAYLTANSVNFSSLKNDSLRHFRYFDRAPPARRDSLLGKRLGFRALVHVLRFSRRRMKWRFNSKTSSRRSFPGIYTCTRAPVIVIMGVTRRTGGHRRNSRKGNTGRRFGEKLRGSRPKASPSPRRVCQRGLCV